MRSTGILRSWNDERGFGFIAPASGGAELFVHVSALPRDGSRPVAGETLTFELGRGKDGKPQAVKVLRTVAGNQLGVTARRRASQPASRGTAWIGRLLVLCLVAAVGLWGYGKLQDSSHRRQLASQPAETTVPDPAAGSPPSPRQATPRRCDGRAHCSQMTSCAEATWFINNCPGTTMDGNGDGVPCEQQWCTGIGAQ